MAKSEKPERKRLPRKHRFTVSLKDGSEMYLGDFRTPAECKAVKDLLTSRTMMSRLGGQPVDASKIIEWSAQMVVVQPRETIN